MSVGMEVQRNPMKYCKVVASYLVLLGKVSRT